MRGAEFFCQIVQNSQDGRKASDSTGKFKMTIEKPAYVAAIAFGIAGIVLAWILSAILPAQVYHVLAGAVGAVFGVLMISRLWPALPFGKAHMWGAALIAYNIGLSLLERIWLAA